MARRNIMVLAMAVAVVAAAVAAWAAASPSPSAAGVDAAPRELPLPQVPPSLTRPADRADYVARHFWEAMDFDAPAAGATDTTFMEQNFVNFMSVLPHTSADSVADSAISRLLDRAGVNPQALALVGWLAEIYLNSTDSPMYSEGSYMAFLRRLSVSKAVEPAMRERYAAQLADMAGNRPGDVAVDFPYESADGAAGTLLALAAAHDSTLMVLYDPDCHDCHELIDALSRDERLRSAAAGGSMAVVAMYPYDDVELWRATAGELPGWWTVARATAPIDEEGIYYIPRTPRSYLLDRAGRIVRLRE